MWLTEKRELIAINGCPRCSGSQSWNLGTALKREQQKMRMGRRKKSIERSACSSRRISRSHEVWRTLKKVVETEGDMSAREVNAIRSSLVPTFTSTDEIVLARSCGKMQTLLLDRG